MSGSFDRFAGWASILAGVAGVGYAVAFVVLKNNALAADFLTLAPLFAVAGLVAVFERVRSIDSGYATLALALGAFGSLAASTHGAYDVSNVLHPGWPAAPRSSRAGSARWACCSGCSSSSRSSAG
jgi:hypothetical protein